MFRGKTLLITGGTGSFGNAVLHRFIDTDVSEIRIFSRDEKKQDDMRRALKNDRVKWKSCIQKGSNGARDTPTSSNTSLSTT